MHPQPSHALLHWPRPRRRPRRAGRPASAAVDLFAEELLRLFEDGHRCFCPECRNRARERELRRRARGVTSC